MPHDPLVLARDDGKRALQEIEAEVLRTAERYGERFANLHEAYAMILEELDEVWDIVRQKQENRSPIALRKELIQVAAMTVRALRSMENFTGEKKL